ncbi:MAG: sigma-54 dependent transcriptional regulator [Acidobacteriota bacterium]|nr:sigma-54 dependent transcriptional regulator [Acidobacteriota bacterium]
MARNKILIVDDEAGIRSPMRRFFEAHGYEIEEADSCQAALEAFRHAGCDAAVLDYSLPDGNTLDLLPQLKAIDAATPVIVLTGHGSIDLAVRMIKEGAEQFLVKPVELSALLVIVKRLIENTRNRQKQLATKTRHERNRIDPFQGTSASIQRLAAEARRTLSTDSPVLIQGETGSGKGVLARWLHSNSPRAEESFVDLNCAGLTREFLETELFGHEKGAFTGAIAGKLGLLEVAHRGTVFLDEIGDMDAQIQPKLLKAVEEKQFRRLGDVHDRRVDIRLIAATHRDLNNLVREGGFRSDLYFRISTIPLRVPPLRERPEDIPVLAGSLLGGLAASLGRAEVSLTPAAERALKTHTWAGNIRELRNVLERALMFNEQNTLDRRDLRFDEAMGTSSANTSTDNLNLTLVELERRHIERVLDAEGNRVDEAAKRLGIPRSSLYQKIKTYGILLSKNAKQ